MGLQMGQVQDLIEVGNGPLNVPGSGRSSEKKTTVVVVQERFGFTCYKKSPFYFIF